MITADDRMGIEKCLTKNYLLKYGMDYFGKKDLIYIDLMGSDDIARQQYYEWEIRFYLNISLINIMLPNIMYSHFKSWTI